MIRALNVSLMCMAFVTVGRAETDVRRDLTVAAIEKVMPAVVNIATETIVPSRHPLDELLREFYDPFYRRQPNRQFSLGSGVVIDEEGYIVTNDHVVSRASRISVKLSDGREFECDRVATSTKNDVALLKIRTKNNEKFVAAKFANDDDLLLGETVMALGNPFGLGGSVSRGILSSKARRPATGSEPLDVQDWLQTDAPINPGNSGGPLINVRGEIIGLSVAVFREGHGIGFAIPIKMVSEALAESFTPENLQALWFGARVKAGSSPLKITHIQPGSPAEKSGLKEGDIVTQVNGKASSSFIEFSRLLTQSNATHEVSMQVTREGKARNVKVQLMPETAFFNAKYIQQRLGVSVQEVTEELAERMGLNLGAGLLIAGVEKGSAAEKAGLERSMLITRLDGQLPVDTTAVAKYLFDKRDGEKVELTVLYLRRRGSFITTQQSSVALPLRTPSSKSVEKTATY